MSFEELENLATAYLLGGLKEDERIDFEQRMASDENLANLVEQLEQSLDLAMLAQTELAEPTVDLRARLLAAIPDSSSSETAPVETPSDSKARAFPVVKVTAALIGWAAAACLAIVYLNQREDIEELQSENSTMTTRNEALETRVNDLSSSVDSAVANNEALQTQVDQLSELASSVQARNEDLASSVDSALASNETLQTQLDALSGQLAEVNAERENLESIVANLRQQTVLDKVQIAALSSEIDELRYGFAVWDNQADQGIVKVFNLAEIDIPNQDYQFWVISPDHEAPVPAGVFQVDAQGRADYAFAPSIPVSAVGAFAISLEPKGGSLSPTGPIVLSGAL